MNCNRLWKTVTVDKHARGITLRSDIHSHLLSQFREAFALYGGYINGIEAENQMQVLLREILYQVEADNFITAWPLISRFLDGSTVMPVEKRVLAVLGGTIKYPTDRSFTIPSA